MPSLPRERECSWSAADSVRARECPSPGEFVHESVFDVPWMSTTGGGWKRKPTEAELTTMRFRAATIGPWLDPEGAEVTVFHMWDESCVGLASIDLERREMRFSSPCGHPPGAFGVQKYVVWNTARGVTKPGQWFLDRRAKKLVYRPMPGETVANLKAYLPTLTVLIGVWDVERVTLRNLDLEVANVPLKAGGFGAGEFDGAITAANCPHLRCENVRVQAVAGTGIKLWKCADAIVTRCRTLENGRVRHASGRGPLRGRGLRRSPCRAAVSERRGLVGRRSRRRHIA